MCSLQVATLTAVKTFVLYPHYYDQEVLYEVYSYCPEAPNGRVKYVAHMASCRPKDGCTCETNSYREMFDSPACVPFSTSDEGWCMIKIFQGGQGW